MSSPSLAHLSHSGRVVYIGWVRYFKAIYNVVINRTSRLAAAWEVRLQLPEGVPASLSLLAEEVLAKGHAHALQSFVIVRACLPAQPDVALNEKLHFNCHQALGDMLELHFGIGPQRCVYRSSPLRLPWHSEAYASP